MHRVVLVALLVVSAACGKVDNNNPGDGPGPGSEGGGGACTSNDQCAAPTPACDTGSGTCVECVQDDQCPADKPTCDTGSHTCRACSVDADCASDVCDTQAGTCVDEATVLYASPTGPDAGTCTKATPCSLVQATALADLTRLNVKLAPGNYSAHVILTNKTLVLFGTGATVNAQGTAATFEVDDGGHLRIVGATVTAASTNTPIRCEGAANATHILELYRATIQNTSTVLLGNPCAMTVTESTLRNTSTTDFHILVVAPSVATFDRTSFVGNGGGGLAGLQGADIKVTNCLFTKVGDPLDSTDHGVFVGSNFNVQFSTVVDSFLECGGSGATVMTLTSSILRDSISGGGDTLRGINSCTSAKFNVVFPSAAPLGATNLIADPQLKNIAANDYHLLVTSPALDHGDPASTLGVDFDGTARPQGAGRDSGALEFKP
jgi:hypothetical protein